MVEVFQEFVWHVPQHGFCSVHTKAVDDAEDDYLVECKPLGSRFIYHPLHNTGLFRTFADTPPTTQGILMFANRFGFLNHAEEQRLIEIPCEGRMVIARAEPLSFWRWEIWAMRLAVELWDAAQAGDTTTLSRRIAWTQGPGGMGVLYGTQIAGDRPGEPHYREWIASPTIHPERLERFPPGDLIMPALYRVQQFVNDHMTRRVSVRLAWDEARNRLELRIVPQNLIGALWLQFARAISGQKAYRRCEECGAWFEVSREVTRSDRLYCSNACRTRAYRKRKELAQQMYKTGKRIEEIAQALGSEESTVAGWVKEDA